MEIMEGEINNFILVWLSVFISLFYCFISSKVFPKGFRRFLFVVLPIVCFFLFLPLHLSSANLCGGTAFFITWLANFKLLLFAFGKGPLSESDPSLSFGHFVVIACLPIEITQQIPHRKPLEKPKNTQYKTNPSPSMSHLNHQNKENPLPKSPREGQVSLLNHGTKGLLLVILIRVFDYREYIHPKASLLLFCLLVYLLLETNLALVGALARALLGLEIEPHFNEPYLSTSLQDFWGKRWNLMVTSILRPTVYNPTRNAMTRFVGRKWASIPAILGAFIVSGLMHELIYFYLGRVRPTWEVTLFFLLHGLCLTVEIILKKAVADRWQLPWLISGPLTLGFIIVTGYWLFFPQFLRGKADVRIFEEYAAVGAFLKNATRACVMHVIGR